MNFNLKLLYQIAFITSLIGLIAIVTDFGFPQTELTQNILDWFYFFVLGVGLGATFARYLKNSALLKRKVFIFDFLSIY
jgi:trk system potassium uptake protein